MDTVVSIVAWIIVVWLVFFGLELVVIGVLDFGDKSWTRSLIAFCGVVFLFVGIRSAVNMLNEI